MKSKDPSTKVGAVIVGPDHEIRATGYNGFPRGIADIVERYSDRSYKYLVCNHAEENAILHCARIGMAIRGCSIYTPWIPCSYCAKTIIQAGIIEVIYHEDFPGNSEYEQASSSWADSIRLSKQIIEESGVILRSFAGALLPISGLYQGKVFTPATKAAAWSEEEPQSTV